MCRNWEIKGSCPYQSTCSFAHGAHELVKKKHLPPNYKTKACEQFHTAGFCPYGNRCQFLHSQFPILTHDDKDDLLTNAQILKENVRLSKQRAAQLVDDPQEGFYLDNAIYLNIFPERLRPRLRVFEKITTASSNRNAQ
jgi:hypothetical protein